MKQPFLVWISISKHSLTFLDLWYYNTIFKGFGAWPLTNLYVAIQPLHTWLKSALELGLLIWMDAHFSGSLLGKLRALDCAMDTFTFGLERFLGLNLFPWQSCSLQQGKYSIVLHGLLSLISPSWLKQILPMWFRLLHL